jgi:hypothetical protein
MGRYYPFGYWTWPHHSGSSASSVLGKQKPRGKHAHIALLSHLLAFLSGSIRQQHGTCGRASFIWPSPIWKTSFPLLVVVSMPSGRLWPPPPCPAAQPVRTRSPTSAPVGQASTPSVLLRKLRQQSLRLLKVSGVRTFSEPVVYLCQQLSGLCALPLSLPEPTETQRRAQF